MCRRKQATESVMSPCSCSAARAGVISAGDALNSHPFYEFDSLCLFVPGCVCVCLTSNDAGEQLFDNNAGQDYTYPTTAGGTWEEWQAAARERAEEQEKERHRAEEVRERERYMVHPAAGIILV